MGVSLLSDESRAIVERRRVAAAARVEELKRESEALHSLATHVDEELRKSTRVLQDAEEMLGLAAQVPFDALHGELRGRRLREVAVELLRDRKGEDAEIHYRELLALLQARGVRVGGKNPAATLLTQLVNAPDVESVRPRSGLYKVKTA